MQKTKILQKFHDTSLRTKLIIPFLLVVIVPMVILAVNSEKLIATKVREEIQRATEQNLEAVWIQYYVRADQMKFGMLQAMEEVEGAILDKNSTFLNDKMQLWKKTRPYVDIWMAVDSEGRVIARLNSDNSGDLFDLNGIVAKALSGGTAVISTEVIPREKLLLESDSLADDVVIPVSSEGNGDKGGEGFDQMRDALMLTVVVPVMDENRVVGAIITGDILNNDNFVPNTIATKIPGSIAAIAKDGIRIATTSINDKGRLAIGTLLPSGVMTGLNRGEVFRGDAVISGKKYITAVDPIRDNKGQKIGSLFVGFPEARFVALHMSNRRNIIITTVFGIIFAIATAVFVTSRLTRPLNMLVQKSRDVASGNMDAMAATDVSEDTHDDVSILARSFSYMIREIKDKNRERDFHLVELEKKTTELVALNEKFRAANQELEVALEESQSQQEELQSANEELVILNEELEKKTNELFEANLKIMEEENALKKTKDQLHLIYNGIKDYIFLLDPDCNILEVNKSFLDAHGLQEKEVIGQKCYKVVYGCSEIVPECDVNKGANINLPFRHRATTLDNKTVERYIFPIFDDNGNLINRVEYIRDVTEEAMLREQLIQAEKLSSLGEILSGVAHELNNPLTGVIGYCELLYDTTEDENLQVQLGKVNDAALRCKKIIENLLSFARQHKVETQYAGINDIIRQALELKVYQMQLDNIKVIMDFDGSIPYTMVDPYTIQQVFLNIINNAHIAMVDKGGQGTLTIKSEYMNGLIRVSFSDSGMGIPESNVKKIFDPFYTTREVGKGTGLGLSVSYGIIKEHNGEIYASSKQGEGTTFFIELPVVSPDRELNVDERKVEPVEALQVTRKRRVLVVDDDVTILDLFKVIIDRMGIEVDAVSDAGSAVEKIRHTDYDLIISDMRMPGMDGKNFYRTIQSFRPELIDKMLFSTGDVINPETRKFLEDSRCKYLTKPFTPAELKNTIFTYLESGKAGDRIA